MPPTKEAAETVIDRYELMGFGIFTGCEGEDPSLVAWFEDRERAEGVAAFMRTHSDDGDIQVCSTAGIFAAWNSYNPANDRALMDAVKKGQG
jgi:hypothetical protein